MAFVTPSKGLSSFDVDQKPPVSDGKSSCDDAIGPLGSLSTCHLSIAIISGGSAIGYRRFEGAGLGDAEIFPDSCRWFFRQDGLHGAGSASENEFPRGGQSPPHRLIFWV
jgi:hypothetical protein